MKKILYLLLFFTFFSFAYADTPYLSSFDVSPDTASSGYLVSLVWSGQNTSGYNLVVSCVSGVKVKSQDGSVFPCGTRMSTSAQNSDSMGLYAINYSGSSKTINFKLYPKSVTGEEYTAGVREKTITVYTSPYPINEVYSSATSTISGDSTTIYWSSNDLDGVNLMLSCVNGVSATSTIDGVSVVIPCGVIAFPNKLSGSSGSVPILFKNSNADRMSVRATVLPFIGDNSYDLSHSQSITLDVASDKTLPSQITSFVSSRPYISSDDSVTLLWTTKYTNGVNVKVDCDESLSFSLVSSTTTVPVSCNKLFSETSFGPNASTTLIIHNIGKQVKSATFTLLAQLPQGGFDGINTRKIYLPVYPKGETVVIQNTASQTSSVGEVVNTTSAGSNNSSSPRKKFYKSLSLGSRGDDVLSLQEYLKQFPDIYPEGLATGYFGPVTTRAVQRFQVKYGIAKSGVPGYGYVGPMTRAKLNSF